MIAFIATECSLPADRCHMRFESILPWHEDAQFTSGRVSRGNEMLSSDRWENWVGRPNGKGLSITL